MKVRYVRERGYEGDGKDPHITLEQEYVVLSVGIRANGLAYIRIITDKNETPAIFNLNCFDIVDERIPSDWIFSGNPNVGLYFLSPKEFVGNFWERFFDEEIDAENIFQRVLRELENFHVSVK